MQAVVAALYQVQKGEQAELLPRFLEYSTVHKDAIS